jgi:caffeoyl-CoA O-methyltransferase
MAPRQIRLTDTIEDYMRAVSLREPDILRRLREETAKLPGAGMQIGPEQGQFMALLVELMGARSCLEIGTFTGYSALAVALALPADGRLVACDVNRDWTDIGRRYWAEAGVAGIIDLRLGPALATLDRMLAAGAAGSIDFAFIDADKPNYAGYYERVLTLLRPGGLMAVDNVLWSGDVAKPEAADEDTLALKALNLKVHADPRVSMTMLPIGDGVTLARKRG